MISFGSDMEEQLELAKGIRAKSVYASHTPEELKEIYEKTRKEERLIPTCEGDCLVRIYYPDIMEKPVPLYINFHGGGFVREWRENDAIFCCKMIADNHCMVVDVDYKLAPEYKYPTAINESYDVVKWVFEHAEELGADKDNIVAGGHSAGGNITASVVLLANQKGDFRLKYQILDYPGLSSCKDGSEFEALEGAIPPERMNQYRYLNFESEADTKNPIASPILAGPDMLRGLPPACIITAEMDGMKDDGELYGQKLVAAGVPVTLKRYLKSRHGFLINFMDEYDSALEFYSEILKYAFSKG